MTVDMADPRLNITAQLPGNPPAKPPGRLAGKLPGKLPGVPGKALDPQQQLEALRRTQAQAEQRVKLGMQLFKAAEARSAQHRSEIEQLRREQAELREQLQQDIARSFQSYDQWIAKVDDTLTNSLKSIEDRIEQLQSRWKETEHRIETMIERSQTLLSQSVEMMHAPPHTTTEPAHEPQAPATPPTQAPAEREKAPFDPIYTEALRRLIEDRDADE